MPVRQVTAATPVEPDHVYVIPPEATLTSTGGVLSIESPPEEPRGHRTSIDAFFRSLAADQGAYAVCIMHALGHWHRWHPGPPWRQGVRRHGDSPEPGICPV